MNTNQQSESQSQSYSPQPQWNQERPYPPPPPPPSYSPQPQWNHEQPYPQPSQPQSQYPYTAPSQPYGPLPQRQGQYPYGQSPQSYPSQQHMMPPTVQPQPPFQQPAMYPPMQQPVMLTNTVQVNVQQKTPGFLMRVLWYIFIGSWLGFFWLQVGYLFCLTIIGLPLGLVMLNRLPWVLTLRPSSQQVQVTVLGNTTTINVGGVQQYSMLVRSLYFVFVGSWAGYLWASLGYAFCLFIITMPIGLMMLNRLPMVLTLKRN